MELYKNRFGKAHAQLQFFPYIFRVFFLNNFCIKSFFFLIVKLAKLRDAEIEYLRIISYYRMSNSLNKTYKYVLNC